MQRIRRNWVPILITLVMILAFLLVILALLVILSIIFSILGRFSQTILLFALGAILAHLLTPLVNGAQRLVRKRWAAILTVYLLLIAVIVFVGVALLMPFVHQTQSLAENFRTPSHQGLQPIRNVEQEVARIQSALASQRERANKGVVVSGQQVDQTTAKITALQKAISNLRGVTDRERQTSARATIPPSYVASIETPTKELAADYARATSNGQATGPATIDPTLLERAMSGAKRVSDAAKRARQILSSTPVAVLSAQDWLDNHGIGVDLPASLGDAIQQINARAASILNDAVSRLLAVGTLLVNTILVVIISIYFASDGGRLVRGAIRRGPSAYRDELSFTVTSFDRVLRAQLRGMFATSLLAGVLGGGGAWLLGVPYPALIGVSTFILILIPVIGPLIVFVPPALIALLFSSLTTAIILLVYFIVFMQIVTNVLGPRITSVVVGIHPLEAMAAALVGYPLAGFLGSFFAVPIVGFLHVVAREGLTRVASRRSSNGTEATAGEPPGKSPLPDSANQSQDREQ